MDKLTLIRELLDEGSSPNPLPFKLGDAYFIRTVTYHGTGRVRQIIGEWLVLEDAAYVADTERFADAIGKGALREVEPVGEWIVNTEAITDAFPWKHPLPMEQK